MSVYDRLVIRDITFRHRIVMSPMCMYSAENGVPNMWHLVHLGSRAMGGAALVMSEATSVTPEGRISPGDTGLYADDQEEGFARIAKFVHDQGSLFGIQLAHAGRKAGSHIPWRGHGPIADWLRLAPSPAAYGPNWPVPQALDPAGISRIVQAFRNAAARALRIGCDVVEIHAAHGYLLHEFLSPISNHRTDEYGGDTRRRMRLVREVAQAVRQVWPERLPLFCRVSATDWLPDGLGIDQTVELARALAEDGVDLLDCSSGGIRRGVEEPEGPGFQVPFAAEVRKHTPLLSAAVGCITDHLQAERIIEQGDADLVVIGRAFLTDPYLPLHFGQQAGGPIPLPVQYADD